MSFGNMDTSRIRRLASYAEALNLWENRPPLRKTGDPNIRQLGKPTQKYLWVWKDEDGSIVLHQHATDIVRYRPDGRIELAPYPSMSTTEIVNLVLPLGIAVDYHLPCTNNGVIGLAEREDIDFNQYRWRYVQAHTAYRISPHAGESRRIVLRQTGDDRWVVDNPDEVLIPFKIPRVHLATAKRAYAAHKLPDFHAWATGVMALMGAEVKPSRTNDLSSPESRLEALEDQENWMPVLQHIGTIKNPYSWKQHMPTVATVMEQLRDDVRRVTEGSIVYDEPMGVEWSRLASVRQAQNTYCNGGTP